MPVVKKSPDEIIMSERLGHCLRAGRNELKLTQRALASRIDVSYQQIGRYETGENDLTVFRFWKLSRALEKDPCRVARVAFSDRPKSELPMALVSDDSVEDELLAIFRNLPNDLKKIEVRNFALAVYRS